MSDAFDDVLEVAKQAGLPLPRLLTTEREPGCAVRAAVAAGQLDVRRLDSYLKLLREAERAAQSVRERRAVERRWGRMARTILKRGPGTSRE